MVVSIMTTSDGSLAPFAAARAASTAAGAVVGSADVMIGGRCRSTCCCWSPGLFGDAVPGGGGALLLPDEVVVDVVVPLTDAPLTSLESRRVF